MSTCGRSRATQPRRSVALFAPLTVLLLALLALAVAVPPSTAVAPTHPAVATKATTSGLKPSATERRVFKLTNRARGHGRFCGAKRYRTVPRLSYSRKLGLAARRHSKDMARHNFFDHYNLAGLAPWDRIEKAGYGRWRAVAENIAAGQQTPREVVTAWLKSPEHCSGIMSKSVRQIGVGFATGPGEYHLYWTQDFAAKW
ncbi:MAG: CAP domain-containing protein [Candidatus Nanopelagicales bacterium]